MIGKLIGASCHVIGWFMPYFFAGKVFSWGRGGSLNDVDFDAKYPVDEAHRYCARPEGGIRLAPPPARHGG